MVKRWMTAHPEVILGSLGEFETCPDWVASMDRYRRSTSINLRTLRADGFYHSASCAAKVRNVSRLGSQLFLLHVCAIRLISLCVLGSFLSRVSAARYDPVKDSKPSAASGPIHGSFLCPQGAL